MTNQTTHDPRALLALAGITADWTMWGNRVGGRKPNARPMWSFRTTRAGVTDVHTVYHSVFGEQDALDIIARHDGGTTRNPSRSF